ncbi:hypothetical protein BSKO_10992 [Bryopsis sp. KO-2023]|nr:hypothetical protein BSKO_10992 [Bryopsis sp. KO-2023]
MFSLIYGLIDYIFRKDELRILILGIDGAGKTTLLERLKSTYSGAVGLPPDKIRPTVGLNVGRVEALSSKVIFWDLGGQSGLRTIWDKYYTETHAVVFVVDASNSDRFDEAKNAMEKVLGSRELGGAPLLVLANKQDLNGVCDQDVVAEHFGVGKIGTTACRVVPVCALTGEGVRGAVDWLLDAVKRSSRTAVIRNRVS